MKITSNSRATDKKYNSKDKYEYISIYVHYFMFIIIVNLHYVIVSYFDYELN